MSPPNVLTFLTNQIWCRLEYTLCDFNKSNPSYVFDNAKIGIILVFPNFWVKKILEKKLGKSLEYW
mgnify:CR=1 FL=1